MLHNDCVVRPRPKLAGEPAQIRQRGQMEVTLPATPWLNGKWPHTPAGGVMWLGVLLTWAASLWPPPGHWEVPELLPQCSPLEKGSCPPRTFLKRLPQGKELYGKDSH